MICTAGGTRCVRDRCCPRKRQQSCLSPACAKGQTRRATMAMAGLSKRRPAESGLNTMAAALAEPQLMDVRLEALTDQAEKAVEEYLYTAMEDLAIDVVIDQGPAARSVRLTLAPFTLVAPPPA
ncbi:MAG: hypothetical protein HC787_00285, partial [Nostocaceae cyanobacterium CSU_2_110]|nr:hypothetical protein [Nostocaceae cyanobacterium CSU_2_110]